MAASTSTRAKVALGLSALLASALLATSASGQSVYYTYDPLGRLTQAFHAKDSAGDYAVTYTYDAAGNRAQVLVDPIAYPNPGPDPVPTNQAPVANGDYFERRIGTTTALLVLANDTDADGNPLHVSAVTTPTGGTATIPSGGASVTYVAPGTPGSYTFSYTANDGQGGTHSASVEVFVKYGDGFCLRYPDNPYC